MGGPKSKATQEEISAAFKTEEPYDNVDYLKGRLVQAGILAK